MRMAATGATDEVATPQHDPSETNDHGGPAPPPQTHTSSSSSSSFPSSSAPASLPIPPGEESSKTGEAQSREEQRRNADERLRMLRFWSGAVGSRVSIKCHGGTCVGGTLVGVDGSQELLHVDSLETPLGKYPQTTMRASDMLEIKIEPRGGGMEGGKQEEKGGSLPPPQTSTPTTTTAITMLVRCPDGWKEPSPPR